MNLRGKVWNQKEHRDSSVERPQRKDRNVSPYDEKKAKWDQQYTQL